MKLVSLLSLIPLAFAAPGAGAQMMGQSNGMGMNAQRDPQPMTAGEGLQLMDAGGDALMAKASAAFRSGGAAAAFPLIAEDAREGSVVAMRDLGLMYARGEGVGRDDGEAARWFRKAADKADPMSMYALGLSYLHGRGVEADPIKARQWLSAAVRHGYGGAAAALASLPH
jgi:TPR repeat protein